MWATDNDIPEIIDFLTPRAAQSMFPLNNLQQFGLNGDHPRAPIMWLTREAGQITDVLSITQEGMVMPQCPSMAWGQYKEALMGRDLIGIIGPAEQARSLLGAVGLADAPMSLDHDEPQFELDLSDLTVPDGAGDIVPLEKADKEQMIQWRYEYELEALNMPPAEARPIAERDYASYVTNKSHVALMSGETALCTTGFNARLTDIVQIGGVYTPPELRGNGHARRAVALHLAQAREEGVKRATLFSANEYASRAYQSIGFKHIGEWSLCIFQGAQVAHV